MDRQARSEMMREVWQRRKLERARSVAASRGDKLVIDMTEEEIEAFHRARREGVRVGPWTYTQLRAYMERPA